jgi:hypothetical protein
MAFKPTFINGRHYLMSKNSGSFPNWAIYLSGSSGAGKLWSEFNIDASVSCSYSSSTVFQTGSVYQVDVKIIPTLSASSIYVNGQSEGGAFGNGGGSLTNTGSLFVGNYSQNNTQNFSGSIYTVKSYTVQSLTQPPINYNVTATRLGKTPSAVAPVFELLVVAGGASGATFRSGGNNSAGGGGAGGLQYISSYTPSVGLTQVIVGNGGTRVGDLQQGANGQNSIFDTYTVIGGGGGGRGNNVQTGSTGGSGGGQGGLGILEQGNDGSVITGGGGGGAGTPGQSFNGGSGSYIASFATIGGSPAGWFAGGGGGAGGASTGFGGIGGGGSGSRALPGGISFASRSDAYPNTGGGGGAVVQILSTPYTGSQGGSGIVAIRYSGTPIALGGEITQSEGYTYHVFRTVGTSSFTIF